MAFIEVVKLRSEPSFEMVSRRMMLVLRSEPMLAECDWVMDNVGVRFWNFGKACLE